MVLTILFIAVFCTNKLSLSVQSSNCYVFKSIYSDSMVILWGSMYNPPLFKGACPCALAVISDSVAYMVQCHSSTIGVGTSGKVGAFHIRVAG